ncbi:MAG: ABC transporter permease [Rubricoccaceae bacterium]|nr:ABC transporter permease [Rubricoccaceae bacterium]
MTNSTVRESRGAVHDGRAPWSVLSAFARLWQQRALLLRSVIIDVKAQYAGTVLGLSWVILGPVLLLVLYAMIYAVIFRIRVPNFTTAEYILNVFSGLVPFLAFAQALAVSVSVLGKERKLLFSRFPAEFIPIKAVMVAYVMLLVGTIMVFIGDTVFSQATWTLLLVPVVALLQLMFSIGLGMILALLSLVLRDIQFIIQYVVIALLIVTPIAYTPDMIPGKLKVLLYLNPLFYYVSAYQHLVLVNTLPPTHITILCVGSSLIMLVGGFWFFARARQALSDLL